MSTKMKGLLKGLRYISQMFGEKVYQNSESLYIDRDDGDDKEPEIQIGFPTDVKHVAHIGWDGSSVSSPSWVNADILAMNEYKGPKQALPDMLNTSTVEAQENSSKSRKDKAKSSTKHHHQPVNSSSPVNSPSRRSKHNRSLMDSPTKGSPGRTSTRQSKKHQNSSLGNVVAASPDTQVVSSPKKSRRRKSKGGSGSGSGQGVSVTTSEEKKERD